MATSPIQNCYSQGSLATLTTTTLNSFGQPTPPDNNLLPVISVGFVTPDGTEPVVTNALMTPITSTFYYYNIDTTYLGIGTYQVTISWIVGGDESVFTPTFSVIPFNPMSPTPMDPISKLRILLLDNDVDPTRWIFNDLELSTYLNMSLDAFNAAPPRSAFFWFNVPMQSVMNIILYSQYLALQSQATKIASQPIQYSDKGLTVDKFRQSQTYLNIANIIKEQAEAERLRQKRQMQYQSWGYIASANMPSMVHPPLRAWNVQWGGTF